MNYTAYSSREGQEAQEWWRSLDSTDRARTQREFFKGVSQPKSYPKTRHDCHHCHRNLVFKFLMKIHDLDNPQKVWEKYLLSKKNGEPFEFLD